MNKRYLIAILIIGIATILFSIFAVFIFSEELLINDSEQQDLIEVMIIPDSSIGTAPLSVNFRSFPKDLSSKVKYSWDFGDGSVSNDKNPIYTYSKAGEYTCKLTVSDGKINSSDTLKINVLENNPPVIKIIVDKTSGNRPMTVNFDVDGFDTDGEIVSYEWEITYPPFFSSQKITEHNERNFSERFIRPGLYEVKLVVRDDYGNVAMDYIKIQVLRHKLELLVGTSMYYYGVVKDIKGIYEKFMDRMNPPTLMERIIDLFEVKR